MHSTNNGISIAKFKSKVLMNLNISYLYNIRPSKYLIICIIDVLKIFTASSHTRKENIFTYQKRF